MVPGPDTHRSDHWVVWRYWHSIPRVAKRCLRRKDTDWSRGIRTSATEGAWRATRMSHALVREHDSANLSTTIHHQSLYSEFS